MIEENLQRIRQKIRTASVNAGRDPATVKLVAVSKRKPAEDVRTAFSCGQLYFAENYLQDARAKIESLPGDIKWHFIGHLQSNKAAAVADLFDMVETLDRIKVARILDKRSHELGKTLSVLVQVNIGEEPQKSGIEKDEAEIFLSKLSEFRNLEICGLMIMPPYFNDPEMVRPYFKAARTLTDELSAKGLFSSNENVELSMGMSSDFEVAIEEGATIIRVGTALFGQRE